MLLISLLSVGMLFSAIFNSFYNFGRNYAFHYHFLFDYISHAALSLLGIYFIKSKQIDFAKKDVFVSSSLIFAVAFLMMILNVVFDTSFFGLSLNGKHNIYNMVIVANSYLSAAIYLVGLSIVLSLGYLVIRLAGKNKVGKDV